MKGAEIEWISTAEAAECLGIGPRTLYRLIDHGELPAYKFGRVIRLQQAEVDQYIQRARIQTGTPKHLYPDAKTTDGDESPQADDLLEERAVHA